MRVFLVMGLLASIAAGNSPVFSSIPIPFTRVNTSYNYIISAPANPAPTFSISGAPSGITVNSSGVVSGTPTIEGSFSVVITATNSAGSTNQSFALIVGSVPTLAGNPTLIATTGTSYSVSFSSTGFPAPTLAFAGPMWMGQNGSTFSGTPMIIGVDSITITATNQFGVATEIWALNVVGVAPVVSGTPSSSAVVGTPYSSSFSSSGTGPFAWSIANAPSWLLINGTGVLFGTPDVAGSYGSIVVTATNSGGSSSASFSLSVVGVLPVISGFPPSIANVSVPYSFSITTSGQPGPAVSISGGPSWLSVNGGVIGGTPDGPGSFPSIVVTASNSEGTDQLTFALTVFGNVPTLSGGAVPTATQGVAYSYTFPQTGVPLGTCSYTGSPSWLTVDSTTCTISGTPPTSAATSFNVTQSNSEGADTKTFTLYVRGVIACSPPTAIANVSYSYQCTSSSQPAPTFTLSGAPAGITIGTSGVISGTPTVVGRFPINISFSNLQEVFVYPTSLLVLGNAAPVFISSPATTVAANQQFSYEMYAQSRPDASFALVSGPTWLHLVDGNYLEGTPTNSDEGSIVVVVQASNGVDPNALQQFVLNIQPSLNPIIRSTCPSIASPGVQYNCDLSATGAAPISYLVGAAPDWLSLEGCCKLMGTPNGSHVGLSSIIVTASNSHLPNDIQTFHILVGLAPSSKPTPTILPTRAPTSSSPPAITSLPPTAVTIGSIYFYPISATGAPAPVISTAVADLPSWLRLLGNILTGSPPPGTAGTATILLTASNGAGPDATQAFVLAISNPPTAPRFLSTPALSAAVGSAYNYAAVVATGTPTPNYTYSGPPFLSLVASGGVVSLTGTPPLNSEGTYPIIVVAANGVAPPDSQTFSLTVSPQVTPQPTQAPTSAPILARITSIPPVSAAAGSPFIYVITATGSPAPIFMTSGLPSWLSFTGGNTISGAPPTGMSGSSTFKVLASQGAQPTAEQYVTVAINVNGNAPFITSTPPVNGTLGSVYTYVARATGTPAPVFLWTLPSWLTSTITPTGDIISGVPPSAGTYLISVVASNGVSPASYQSFNVTVAVVPTPAPTRAPTSANTNVHTAPLIISVPPNTVTTGSTFYYRVVAIGSPTPVLSTTQLPSWLRLSGCCDINGTAPAQATGSVTWVVSASNGVLPAGSQTITVTFQSPPAPKFISVPITTTKAAALYQYVINVQGNPAPAITTGSLPSWLRLMGNILIGTPPIGTQGAVPIALTASNGIIPNDEQSFLITIGEQLFAPTIASLPSALMVFNGSLFTYAITAFGNPDPTISTVNVPSWLTLSGNTLSGFAPQQGGQFDVAVQAANGILPNAQQSFIVEVLSKPSLSLVGAPSSASVGYIYSFGVQTTSSPAPVFTMSSNASWLGFNANTVSGSPPLGTTGTFCYTITATNALGSDSDTACLTVVAAGSCASTLDGLLAELHILLSNTRATCEPSLGLPSPYSNSTCHQQCDHPVVLVNDLSIGVSSGRRLMSRMLFALSEVDQTVIANSAAAQWGLPPAKVHAMSDSSSSEVRLLALTPDPLPSLSSVNNVPVTSSRQSSAAQTDMLALIADVVPKVSPQVSSGVPMTVVADTAWYVYLIVMLLVATAVCWILFFVCVFRKEEEPQKLRGESIALEKFNRSAGERCLEDEEIQAARLELENYNRELEALQAVHEEAKAEAARKEQAGQFEQAEVSRLLKQMVELEATQQQQHAAQVSALNSEIATLKAKAAGAQDAQHSDRVAQAQQHEELKRLSEEYQKLKSDRALLQADDLKNQKKLLDTVENLTRALEKSRADSEEMRNAIEEEKRRRLAAENARVEREKQERAAREQDRLLREQEERERAAKERERVEKERQQREAERLDAERQRLRLNREQMEKDRVELERLDALARERERSEALAREREALEVEKRRIEAERIRAERDRLEKERLALERTAMEKEKARLEAERLRTEKDRLEKERLELERIAMEKEKVRLEAERQRAEKERLEKERLILERVAMEKEKARLEAETRLEKQRQEKERLELEKAALEADKARLAQERIKKEEERKKRELERAQLQRQHQVHSARSKSPSTPDPNGFSDDSGIEDDSEGSGPDAKPLHFFKGPGLQDSDDENNANKYRTLSRAQGGVLEQWKQREKAANDAKAKEKRRAARRLARRKARHEARREAGAAKAPQDPPM